MTKKSRPLSPHLSVYKPQITSVLSISHRATGALLFVALLVMSLYLLSAALGEHAYSFAQGIMLSWFGMLVLVSYSFFLFYHMCNGIRHLVWDAGKGFELKTAALSGWAVVIGAAILTALLWARIGGVI